jgi:hypothetical protein
MNKVSAAASEGPYIRQPDEPDEAQLNVGLKDTCIVVAAFGVSILVSGLLFIVMLWGFQALGR